VSHATRPPTPVGRDRSRSDALGTSAPVDDLGFIDLVAEVIGGRQARSVVDRTVDVDHPIAGSTDEVVVVVPDPVLVASGRPGRLDAPEEALLGKGREGVVYRLDRDGTDLTPDGLGHGVGCDMRFIRDGPKNGQPLGGDPKAALTKEVARIKTHVVNSNQRLERVEE
jgi:hypothetical protein